ncbi:MAG: D-alanine--D-alanine ligase [Dehalococcoidia bacterium]|nr:D-alanine--D-alanine ligase [Dehalococcoidia bacterium]
MAGSRLRLGLIFGGRSVEHEVSVVSAQHVIEAADPARFEVVPIGVTKDGVWLTPDETISQLEKPDALFKKRLVSPADLAQLEGRPRPQGDRGLVREISPSPSMERGLGGEVERPIPDLKTLAGLDAVFPLIHGRHGEDGTLQGLLDLLDMPYVGCGVAASAVGMDKALMKAVFLGNGLPIGEHIVIDAAQDEAGALASARLIEERIGYPAFVKPANGGSSVGINKASDREALALALTEASRHDRKLVIEKTVKGREVECAILGNADAQASPVGEIRYQREFYDYEAKYLDPATEILAPSPYLTPDIVERVQSLALRAFHAIDGAGLSRVDFFLLEDGSLLIDEINTIPGFTPASMFPRLWQAAGVDYSKLITRLVDLALARH